MTAEAVPTRGLGAEDVAFVSWVAESGGAGISITFVLSTVMAGGGVKTYPC